jgi:hypothetical protein
MLTALAARIRTIASKEIMVLGRADPLDISVVLRKVREKVMRAAVAGAAEATSAKARAATVRMPVVSLPVYRLLRVWQLPRRLPLACDRQSPL